MIHKLNNIFAQFLTFTKVNIKSKLNNLPNSNLLKFSNLGVPLFMLMILNLLLANGLKEIKKTSFLILSMSTLAISISLSLNRFIVILKWDLENHHNKWIFVMNNMLNFHFIMLINYSNKKYMMKS